VRACVCVCVQGRKLLLDKGTLLCCVAEWSVYCVPEYVAS